MSDTNYISSLTTRKEAIKKQLRSVLDLQKELDHIEGILSLQKEVAARPIQANGLSVEKYNNAEQRVIDSLRGLGGGATVKEMVDYYLKLHSNENKDTVTNSIRQNASRMRKAGKIEGDFKNPKKVIYKLKTA